MSLGYKNWKSVQSSSIDFVRNNLKTLTVVFLTTVIPFHIPLIIFEGYHHPKKYLPLSLLRFKDLDFLSLIQIGVDALWFSALSLSVVTLVKLYSENYPSPILGELKEVFFKKYFYTFLGTLIFLIILNIGFLLLAVPGLYLTPITSIAIIILCFEARKSLFEIFKESSRLLRNNWFFVFVIVLTPILIVLCYQYLIARFLGNYSINFNSQLNILLPSICLQLFGDIILIYTTVNLVFTYLQLKPLPFQAVSS